VVQLLDAPTPGWHDPGELRPKLANIGSATRRGADGDAARRRKQEPPTGSCISANAELQPHRIATPPTEFPLARPPGAVAGPGYSPFIRIAGSNVIYNAPIVATGSGPFDVVHHTNTGDRVLGIHIAGKSKPGQFAESWADLLFVKGFDAGQPILYLSTDAKPAADLGAGALHLRARAEDNAAFNGGDDFLGSARERHCSASSTAKTGAADPQAQGVRAPDQGRSRRPGRQSRTTPR
jgi:hypothetical protein